MTIAEIERTLETLFERHRNLDEEMLITLLNAGGWESVSIKEAVSIFRTLLPKMKQGGINQNKVEATLDTPPALSTSKILKKENLNTSLPEVVKENVNLTPEIPLNQKIVADASLQENKKEEEIVYFDNVGQEEKVVTVFAENSNEENNIPNSTVLEKVLKNILPEPVAPQKVEVTPLAEEASKVEEIVYFDNSGQEERDITPSLVNDVVVSGKESLEKVDATIFVKPGETKNESPILDIPQEEINEVSLVQENSTNKGIFSKNDLVMDIPSVPVTQEPISLIEQKTEEVRKQKEVSLPENLPLKPFDSAPHIWPFSKYKQVFHGETMPVLQADERALVNEISKSNISAKAEIEEVSKKVKIKRTGFDGEDEGLIFLTGTTLLIILLLLAYMYSNGRF